MKATAVNVFHKGLRGVWFGDPAAARTLSVCADLERSLVDIFTSAEKMGATRAPFVTALVLQFLGRQGPATRKAVLEGCFWDPSDRAEYNRLRARISKNITRLADAGLVDTESRQETVLRHTGKALGTHPRRTDGSRIISETERILLYLEAETEVRRQELLADVRRPIPGRFSNTSARRASLNASTAVEMSEAGSRSRQTARRLLQN